MEVRHIQQVRENVVSIEAQQRVEIENQRGNRRYKHNIVRDIVHRTRTRPRPNYSGDGCDEYLHDHSRRANERPTALAAEAPTRRCIHIRHGRENHEHDTHHVHFPSPLFAEKCVTEFVRCFHENKREIQQWDVLRSQDGFRFQPERSAVFSSGFQTVNHHCSPDQKARPRNEPANDGHCLREEAIRIKQRKPHEHDVPKP